MNVSGLTTITPAQTAVISSRSPSVNVLPRRLER